jgi:hypothetical protein
VEARLKDTATAWRRWIKTFLTTVSRSRWSGARRSP